MEFLQKLIEKFLIFQRKRKSWYKVIRTLECITVAVTTYALILPAISLSLQEAGEESGIVLSQSADAEQAGDVSDDDDTVYYSSEQGESANIGYEEPVSDVAAALIEAAPVLTGTIYPESLDLYAEKSVDAYMLASMPQGASVNVLEDQGDGWLFVSTPEGLTGYMKKAYVLLPGETIEEKKPAMTFELIADRNSPDAEIDEAYIDGTFAGPVKIHVEAPVGAFPVGTTMKVRPVAEEQVREAVKSAVPNPEIVSRVSAVDITFFDACGDEIEPDFEIKVSLTSADISAKQEPVVVHVDDEGQAQVVEAKKEEENVVFESDKFSVYVIVETTIEKNVLASDGKNYRISVTYGPDAGIPEGAELVVSEVLDEEKLNNLTSHAEEALNSEYGDRTVTSARFFEIEIWHGEEKIEPKESVEVSISYADPIPIEEDQCLDIVHFAQTGTEVISDVVLSDDGTELTYEQSSFSITGTVVSNGSSFPENGSYVLLLHSGNNYYAVRNDGHLEAVTYNGDGTVTFENATDISAMDDYYWSLTGNNSNRKYLNNGNRYIDPYNNNGLSNIQRQLRLSNNRLYYTYWNNYYYLNINGNQLGNTTTSSNAPTVLFADDFQVDGHRTYTATFNINGGTGSVPSPQTVTGGDDITFPENTSTRSGRVFVGWSTDSDATGSGVAHHRSAVYQPGDTYILNANTTFYAVWAEENPSSSFYLRLDGRIPQEPCAPGEESNYEANSYTKGVTISNAIKVGKFYANTSGVDDNLNSTPTANQLVAMINDSSSTLGIQVQNIDGKVVVSRITNASANSSHYDVSVGDELYVIWYVCKKASAGPVLSGYSTSSWHVDGVLLTRQKVNLIYDANAPAGTFSNMPIGSQWSVDSDVVIGNDGGNNSNVKQPARSDGYLFTGWQMFTKDEDGNYTVNKGTYATNDHFTITEDTKLVAQWIKDTTSFSIVKKDQNDSTKLLDGAQFKLTSLADGTEEIRTTTGGRAGFHAIEIDTLYKLEEIEAPVGYKMLESPIYFKETKSGSTYSVTFYSDGTGTSVIEPGVGINPTLTGPALEISIGNERKVGNAEFTKIDEAGVGLGGAAFGLFLDDTCATIASYTAISETDGKVHFSNIPTGTYYMKETEAPTNYNCSDDIYEVVIDEGSYTIRKYEDGAAVGENVTTITNELSAQPVSVWKTDMDHNALTGASFALYTAEDYKESGTDATPVVPDTPVGTNGILPLGNLEVGTYRLVETQAPDGYISAASEITIIVSPNAVTGMQGTQPTEVAQKGDQYWVAGQDDGTWQVRVWNNPGVELPHTGGPGTNLIYLIGIMLTGLAGAGLLLGRRKRNTAQD